LFVVAPSSGIYELLFYLMLLSNLAISNHYIALFGILVTAREFETSGLFSSFAVHPVYALGASFLKIAYLTPLLANLMTISTTCPVTEVLIQPFLSDPHSLQDTQAGNSVRVASTVWFENAK
jgi:hypothetical protein